MSAVAEVIEALVRGGMSPTDAAVLVARVGIEVGEKPPSKGAERTRRWRVNRANGGVTERHKPSPNVTQSSDANNVTNRHKPSQTVTSDGHISSFFLTSTDTELKKDSKKDAGNCGGDDWPNDYESQFWDLYPGDRKYDRKRVMKKLAGIRGSGETTWYFLISGLRRFIASETDPKFIPAPLVWINQSRWSADYSRSNRERTFLEIVQGGGT